MLSQNYFRKAIRILKITMVCILPALACAGEQYADTADLHMKFGMRARKLPTSYGKIHAPIIIRRAPTNEATAITLSSGEIKVFYINRPGMANKMMSISSTDDGRTWSDSTVEFDLPGEAYYANQVLQDKKGKIHLVFHLFKPGRLGYRGRHLDLWYASKEPGGVWTKPRMIWEGYVGSLRGFIELKNGTLLIPMSESDTLRANKPKNGEADHGLFQIISLYSDDKGSTWKKSTNSLKVEIDPAQVSRYGAVEPNAIELNDGRVWMLIRTNKGYLYESYSTDGGRSWSEATQSAFISSDSPASTIRLSDGRIVLFLNSDQRYDDKRSYANGGREALHAAISSDEGKSWKGFREVLVSPPSKPILRGDRGTAYPSPVQLTNGKILFASGQGEESSIAAFDPNWLLENNQQDDASEPLLNWTLSAGNTGVWNFPMSAQGEISITLKINGRPGKLDLALTDHFSVAHDSLATSISPFAVSITEEEIKKKNITINLGWDLGKSEAYASINGKNISHDRIKFNPSVKGFNYLRAAHHGYLDDDKIYRISKITMRSKIQ
jgi:hypothetical protein